jgi:hypothetical protein
MVLHVDGMLVEPRGYLKALAATAAALQARNAPVHPTVNEAIAACHTLEKRMPR